MKKKILSLCLIAVLLLTAIGGATLAYFTDTDSKTNTFTTAKVDITLVEDFDEDNAKLLPGQANAVKKEVYVKNESNSETSYVRVHIAVPSALVDQEMMSYNDMLHWNFKADAYKFAGWSMQRTYTEGDGWTANGLENQNVYNTEIDDVEYTVWVVTYRTALGAGETTPGAAMTQMYLDANVDTNDGSTYTKGDMSYTLPEDGKIPVLVIAEGTQAAGFDNAYDALNTAFGAPGSYNPWAN